MKMAGREIVFGHPPHGDIVIFDETNSAIVKAAISSGLTQVVFHVRPERVFIGATVFLIFVRRFWQHPVLQEIKHRKGFFTGLLRYIRRVYLEACIISVRPKAVVTFIDNSNDFHWLSKNCRLFPFIAIQNGTRLRYMADNSAPSTYYLQHLFSYGGHEVSTFADMGYAVENFYPAGSLLASLNFEKHRAVTENRYDLLVISTWRGNIGFAKEVQDTMHSMKVMDILLAKYTRERGIKTAIILRAERDSEHWFMRELGLNEADYFNGIYGSSADIIETDFSERNIFPLMKQSRLIVSCLSSALYEAFGIGKKIMFYNFTGSATYHQDIDPAILQTDCNYETFSAQLDQLLAVPQAQYVESHNELMKYYMSFPVNKPSSVFIAEKIDSIIEEFYTQNSKS